MQISTKGIRKTYEQSRALNETDFTVEDGEFVTLLGPSGCGKTTFLRIIAGFVQPDCGKVFIGDSDITEMPPNKRGIGMVDVYKRQDRWGYQRHRQRYQASERLLTLRCIGKPSLCSFSDRPSPKVSTSLTSSGLFSIPSKIFLKGIFRG